MSIGTIYEKAYKGDYNQVKVKIDENNLLVLTPDESRRLLIHWAALGGNENLVAFLLDQGSPVDYTDNTNTTPLILAASAGRYFVVKLLIDRGADVNHTTNRGQSSLHYACSKGHLEVAKLLINADANVNAADILGATPLHRAAAQGRNAIVQLLVTHPKIDVDAVDSTGSTPLHLACEEDREASARMLVKAGAGLNVSNKAKKTPLGMCSLQLKQILGNLME